MLKVTLILGLPGSGKTTYALALTAGQSHTKLFDDFATAHCGWTHDEVEDVGHIVITDPTACGISRSAIEAKLREWFGDDILISIIAFENDPVASMSNVWLRADGRAIDRTYIEMLSQRYDPSQFDIVVPVWKNK